MLARWPAALGGSAGISGVTTRGATTGGRGTAAIRVARGATTGGRGTVAIRVARGVRVGGRGTAAIHVARRRGTGTGRIRRAMTRRRGSGTARTRGATTTTTLRPRMAATLMLTLAAEAVQLGYAGRRVGDACAGCAKCTEWGSLG